MGNKSEVNLIDVPKSNCATSICTSNIEMCQAKTNSDSRLYRGDTIDAIHECKDPSCCTYTFYRGMYSDTLGFISSTLPWMILLYFLFRYDGRIFEFLKRIITFEGLGIKITAASAIEKEKESEEDVVGAAGEGGSSDADFWTRFYHSDSQGSPVEFRTHRNLNNLRSEVYQYEKSAIEYLIKTGILSRQVRRDVVVEDRGGGERFYLDALDITQDVVKIVEIKYYKSSSALRSNLVHINNQLTKASALLAKKTRKPCEIYLVVPKHANLPALYHGLRVIHFDIKKLE